MSWNSALHPRAPKGGPAGGQFAKGSAPAPSKKPAANGSRYSKKQFGQLKSLNRQHAGGKKLTGKQAHALHVAHELHLAHEQALAAKAKAAKAAPKAPARARATRKAGTAPGRSLKQKQLG